MSGITLADYAAMKGFDVDWLRGLHLSDDPRGLCLPYLDAEGVIQAHRLRHGADAPHRFSWFPGETPLPYGLWLPLNRQARGMVLCEGESDAQSMWRMGLPCLGLPGATSMKRAWAGCHIRDTPLWLHVENDAGGERFLEHTLQGLRAGGIRGPIYRFSCAQIAPGCKDISDLYLMLGCDAATAAIRQALCQRIPAQEAQAQPPAPPARPRQALVAYQASDLWGATLPRPLMVLDNTLTAGLCLLAGAPKKGKSWLALALALAVAKGEPLLGRSTRPGEVLYLDLESRQYRVQERLAALHSGQAPEGLFICHHAPRLHEGLIPLLEDWLLTHPTTALIIIDTLARVKSPGVGGENVYEADTRLMGQLQRLALDHGLCLLLIHHLRKSAGGVRESDVYERVSGSTGLTGVCDCVLVLDGKRQDSEALLHVDGRDIPARQLALTFDAGRWQLLSEDGAAYQAGTAYEASPLPRLLKMLLKDQPRWEGSASELCDQLEILSGGASAYRPETVYQDVMALMPRLAESEGITTQRIRSRGNRLIRLRRGSVNPDAQATQIAAQLSPTVTP